MFTITVFRDPTVAAPIHLKRGRTVSPWIWGGKDELARYPVTGKILLGEKDSNPHKQIQSLSCYRYTIPQYSIQYKKSRVQRSRPNCPSLRNSTPGLTRLRDSRPEAAARW